VYTHWDHGGPKEKLSGTNSSTGKQRTLPMGLCSNVDVNRPLTEGLCFSNKPMLAINGEFGGRLEDCNCLTDNGPV